jgi:hypothetical protein
MARPKGGKAWVCLRILRGAHVEIMSRAAFVRLRRREKSNDAQKHFRLQLYRAIT